MHLTNNKPVRNDSLAALDHLDAAGAPEQEITPAMIQAGVAAHAGYHPEFDAIENVVADIWHAMESSKSRKTDGRALAAYVDALPPAKT